MLEPPSDELLRRLREGGLCRPSDLRRAARQVRRLARDLPAFDSVWIDALVQLGCLTPYQARVLESPTPAALWVDDLLLLDELGRSGTGTTWLARGVSSSRERWVVKRVRGAVEKQAQIAELARQLVERAADFEHPHILPPRRCRETREGLLLVSPWRAGIPLGELLIRRGRFPAPIVGEVGRQLALGLGAWHQRGGVHGDVRLSHVRLDSTGRASLVEAGIRPVIEPEITLHTSLSLEAYDGIAPERIGIGQPPTPAADWYAVGCLLWQLLAGRPPFAVADPLAKLAAHQTRTIDDVREWAPETPTALAELIRDLTQRSPAQRPAAATEILARLSTLRLPGRRGLQRFRQAFSAAVPHFRTSRSTAWRRGPAGVTAAALLVAGAVWFADRDHRADLVTMSARLWTDAKPPTAEVAVVIDAASGLLPLPEPTPEGIVWLTEAGPYAAGALRHPGGLQLRAIEGVCPEILIRDQPLRVACGDLTIAGVRIRRDSLWSQGSAPRGLVLAQTQSVTLERCLFDTGTANPRRPAEPLPTGLAWKLVEPHDPAAGRLAIEESVFLGQGTALFANEALRTLAARNVLHVGADAWLDWQTGAERDAVRLELNQVTVRESVAMIRCRTRASDPSPRIELHAVDAVLAVSPGGSLIEWWHPSPVELSAETLVWSGASTLMTAEARLITWRASTDEAAVELPADELTIDGLGAGRIGFAGPATANPADSVLLETDVPRSSARMPGIELTGLEGCSRVGE
jgi:hypothetical protein